MRRTLTPIVLSSLAALLALPVSAAAQSATPIPEFSTFTRALLGQQEAAKEPEQRRRAFLGLL